MDVVEERCKAQRSARRLERAQHQAAVGGGALLMCEAVMARTGLAKSTLYAAIREGKFPAPLKLGARCARWHSASVEAWLAAQLGA